MREGDTILRRVVTALCLSCPNISIGYSACGRVGGGRGWVMRGVSSTVCVSFTATVMVAIGVGGWRGPIG